jgi:hypothetical protein
MVADGMSSKVGARAHRAGLTLTAATDQHLSASVDGRGRLVLPAALRSAGCVVIGARTGAGLVVVAPATVLDGLGDVLTGDHL